MTPVPVELSAIFDQNPDAMSTFVHAVECVVCNAVSPGQVTVQVKVPDHVTEVTVTDGAGRLFTAVEYRCGAQEGDLLYWWATTSVDAPCTPPPDVRSATAGALEEGSSDLHALITACYEFLTRS